MGQIQFKGAITALVTPFKKGEINLECYREIIEWQIEQGINGLVSCGTTGESATLTYEEYKLLIEACVKQTKGRVPVIAGAGSNDTAKAIQLTKIAKELGVDGVLHVTPYYNKPTQEGLYQHFKAIVSQESIPILLYNVPGRTGCNLLPETVARIAQDIPEIVGIKDATGNLEQFSEIIEFCPIGFQVLTGDDFTILPSMTLGGCGVISVISNIVPAMVVELCSLIEKNKLEEARQIHYNLAPLCRLMFVETNPIPVKTALSLMEKLELEFRLPLTELSPINFTKLESTLKNIGIITK